jgi:feruloyl esterase
MTQYKKLISRGDDVTQLAGCRVIIASAISLALATMDCAQAQQAATAVGNLEALCRPETVQAVVAKLSSATVTVKEISSLGAPKFSSGTQFTAAAKDLPAFCQVTGSFVTNAKAGSSANFLATFPANWNGKFLQVGCSGTCGNFYVSNPATPSITVTTQGTASDIINKGYAAFATDEGHQTSDVGEWAVNRDGSVNEDRAKDFLYRADKVLARMGKEFTLAFYAGASNAPRKIARSYFTGCSEGGRDAYVAASLFPEEYDGIIGGSPGNFLGLSYFVTAINTASSRSPDAKITPELAALIDPIVKAECDELDGVKDGIIQNPAACNFNAERDLPRCEGDKLGGQCFTKSQIETVAVMMNGLTDEHGNVVQPGFSVSEFHAPWGEGQRLGNSNLKVFVHKNDPGFSAASIFTFRDGGPGQVTGFHAVVSSAEIAKATAELRTASGNYPEDAAKLIKLNRKFLLWSNFSDNTVIPFTAVNYYKKLSALQGGYANLQKNVRLFMLPGTDHCSITSIAPNGFDALTTLENWVEKGQAPESIIARVVNRQFTPGASAGSAQQFPNWTMPLCKFPEMAHYSGQGDLKDAANWRCPANDRSMLKVGESGKQAGVVQ